jgi:hypothetical protein
VRVGKGCRIREEWRVGEGRRVGEEPLIGEGALGTNVVRRGDGDDDEGREARGGDLGENDKVSIWKATRII